MKRPPRVAKSKALEMLVGSEVDDDDEVRLQSDDSEGEASSNDQAGDDDELVAIEDLPNDDVLEDVVVFWPSDDDSEESNNDEDLRNLPYEVEVSKDGREWKLGLPPNPQGRQPKRNVFHGVPGAIRRGINPESEREAFLIFADGIIEKSVIYTNLQGRRTTRDWRNTSQVEMEAFFGLLILAGAFKAQYRSTIELWSEREGHPVFRATMTRNRFVDILSNLRFDDPLRRDHSDVLAPVRDVTATFISSLKKYVVAPEYLCADEQLLEFHGRVRFLQYIPSKPGKFGIKIFWLTDSQGNYCFNGLIYVGAATLSVSERSESSSFSEAVIMNLMKPFFNNGRHLTADNWFSSASLTEKLLAYYTTYLGTMRRNQRSIPPSLKSTAGRKRGDSKFAHNESMLLVSFWDKGTQPVLLVDSLHRGNESAEGDKPSTVLFYNKTKSGVDNMDKKIRSFSCKRKCRRWPVAVVCNFVDISCINAKYLFENSSAGKDSSHYEFLKSTGYQLVDALIQKRMLKASLRFSVRAAMGMLGYHVDAQRQPILLEKPRRCQLCPYSMDHKTKAVCTKCTRAMCGSHRAYVCTECSP